MYNAAFPQLNFTQYRNLGCTLIRNASSREARELPLAHGARSHMTDGLTNYL